MRAAYRRFRRDLIDTRAELRQLEGLEGDVFRERADEVLREIERLREQAADLQQRHSPGDES